MSHQEIDVVPCVWTPCDIIGELQGRSIYDVTDLILFYLDWPSLKNVGLVSKSWRATMLVTLEKVIQNGNPNWSAEQLTSWRRIKSHVEKDFQVPVDDPCHIQCLANSINLGIDHLWDGCWPDLRSRRPQPVMTLDYLPFLRKEIEDPRIRHIYRVEMNDNFIVAWESSSRLFKCWSRRTLSPISIEPELQMRLFPSISLDEVKKDFHLLGNDLFYAASSTSEPRGNFAKVDLTKVDLDAKRRGIDEAEEFRASIYVEPPISNAKMLVDYLNVVADMILLGFAVFIDGKKVADSLTIQWKLDPGETREVLKCDTLQLKSYGLTYFDKDYLIVQLYEELDDDYDDLYKFCTYSVHPPKDGGTTVELRCIASFAAGGARIIDYRDGVLAYTTVSCEIVFVDVASGAILDISILMDIISGYNIIRLTRDFLIRTVWDGNGTTFHVWNLRSIDKEPPEDFESTPTSSRLRTFTRYVKNFCVDDLGIVAIVENDPAMGIQVLSFLPACSHCKRLTKPALLTKCSRCKSAAYCSEECRTADWNPHHEAICAKMIRR